MTNFHCLVNEIWEKIVFYVVVRREKTSSLYCFLGAKNSTQLNYGESKCLGAPVGDVDTTCSDAKFKTYFICTRMSVMCHWYMYLYVIRMQSYVNRVSFVYSRMSCVCNRVSFVYVIRMYLYNFAGIHRVYAQKKKQ